MEFKLKGFIDFINERNEVLRLRTGQRFTKEDLEKGLIPLQGKELGRKAIYKEIETLLNIKINDGSFQKIVDAGVLIKGTRKGTYIFNPESARNVNSKESNDPAGPNDLNSPNSPNSINLDDMEVGAGKARTLDKIGAKKSIKYKIPVSSRSGKFNEFVENVLLNMINTSKGQEKGSLLLKGDPGTGKTSSVEQFSDIVGMNIITIEAPHVSEDAIISVPYLIKKGLNVEQRTAQMRETEVGFEVISAESSLISELKSKKPMKLADWNKAINKFPHLAKIRDSYKRPIKKIRETYNTILFIDELYRCFDYSQEVEVEILDKDFLEYIKTGNTNSTGNTDSTYKIKIGKLYDLTEQFYGNVDNIPKDCMKIQNEKLLDLHKKCDDVYELKLNNGVVLLPASKHVMYTNDDKEIYVKDIKSGDLLFNNIEVISNSKIKEKVNVYDISVDNETSTYELGGTKHHNTGSKRIQNLFRTILNGYLGDTPIPKNIYIIFASNMDNTDGSLDDIPLNHQFSTIGFDIPSKDDFMAYIGSKFAGAEGEEDTSVVKPEVYNKFLEVLEDEDMGHKDPETGIRVSPRRWEEIIKYISHGIPPKDQKSAEALVHFIYTNMRNYKEKTHSSIAVKYAETVKELIRESSNFNVDAVTKPNPDDWENLFENQIKTKMALGGERRYVTSLAGLPGVGKTTTMRRLAKKMGMKLIEIDCSTLNSEDVIGLTTPSKGEDEVLRTKFTAPPLWSKIMDQYDPSIKIPGSSYTHILFLDEITRSSKRVMNSIRSLMLEKKVNANFAIPADMMIVTAMNPTDTGAEELSDHLADVMDIIDVEVKEAELFKYFRTKEENNKANEEIGFDITAKITTLFRELINKLESDINSEGEPISGNTKKWYWNWDNNVIYVSPRELDDMISGSIGLITTKLIDFEGYDKKENYSEEEYMEFIDIIKETIIQKTTSLLSFIGENKHDIEPFAMQGLYDFIKFQVESENFDEIMNVQSENIVSVKSMVEDSNYDYESMLEYDELGGMIESYIESVEPEELVTNISDIIDVIVNDYSSTPTEFITNIIGLYKVLSTVNWDQYSSKVSANITEALLQRGLKVYAQMLLKQSIDNNMNYSAEIEAHKYHNILVSLSTKQNYFKIQEPQEV